MVGANPTGPIDKIKERPKLSSIWHLQYQLVDGVKKVGNVQFPLDGHVIYILSKEAFSLFYIK